MFRDSEGKAEGCRVLKLHRQFCSLSGWDERHGIALARFVGKSNHSQKKRHIPFESWRWDDAINVFLSKSFDGLFQKLCFCKNVIILYSTSCPGHPQKHMHVCFVFHWKLNAKETICSNKISSNINMRFSQPATGRNHTTERHDGSKSSTQTAWNDPYRLADPPLHNDANGVHDSRVAINAEKAQISSSPYRINRKMASQANVWSVWKKNMIFMFLSKPTSCMIVRSRDIFYVVKWLSDTRNFKRR